MMLHKQLSVVGLGLVLLAVQPGEAPAQTVGTQVSDTIRFGASLPLTGALSIYGKRVRDGYDFYANHVNDIGRWPFASQSAESISAHTSSIGTKSRLDLINRVSSLMT